MHRSKHPKREQVETSGKQSHSRCMEALKEHMVVIEWVSEPS